MSEIDKEILKTLDEIRKWVRFSGWNNVKNVLTEALNELEKIVAYSMTDGKTSIRDINSKIGRSFGTVQGWWKDWAQIGIVETFEYGRGTRAVALFKLDEFGIPIPNITPVTIDEKKAVEEDEQ